MTRLVIWGRQRTGGRWELYPPLRKRPDGVTHECRRLRACRPDREYVVRLASDMVPEEVAP
jgi:hypothetical protein